MMNLKDKAAAAAAKVASTEASVAGKLPSPFRKQSPGNPMDEREIQEQGDRWSKIKELELLCAQLSHQIYLGAIQVEGFEVLLQDAEPQGWKPGLVILRNFATSSLFVVFRGTGDGFVLIEYDNGQLLGSIKDTQTNPFYSLSGDIDPGMRLIA